jgi:hypothetical protein
MAKDFLSEFGPEAKSGARPSNGGKIEPKELPYDPPVGPKGIQGNNKPGLGGTNYGNCGTQGKR